MTKTTKPMKDKPELKREHLAPYLPFKLKMVCHTYYADQQCTPIGNIDLSAVIGTFDNVNRSKIQWCGVTFDGENGIEFYDCFDQKCRKYDMNFVLTDVKPIYYPLSDLTKPKFPDGSKNSNPAWWKLKIQVGILDSLDYNTVQELLEKHYDLFGLIEKGLAIDVNELSENPYK